MRRPGLSSSNTRGELRAFLRDSVINVFSDEGLTCPYVYPANIAAQLWQLFQDSDTEIQIVATLRQQTSLMYSYLTQLFYVFKAHSLNTPSQFYFDVESECLPVLWGWEYTKMFNYFDTLMQYATIYGRNNISILLLRRPVV